MLGFKILAGALAFPGLLISCSAAAQPSRQVFPCDQREEQISPPGAGVASIRMLRQNGSVDFMKIAYNRGSGWFDDSLESAVPPDNFNGPFPINDISKFQPLSSNKSIWVKVYGYYSDDGTARPFRITKECTAKVTRINYFNRYDSSPNIIIDITWTKEYP